MTKKLKRNNSGGAAGPLFLVCAAAAAAGTAFDFNLAAASSFWLGAQPGGAAALGALAAAFAVLAGYGARALLERASKDKRDAGA